MPKGNSKNNSVSQKGAIVIKGARVHNLKNINVEIPRDKLVVITGLSGSGKSSLAFDTIYAEGQRRYVESLSAYARQFLGLMDKPDADSIEGLGPAISIDQRSVSHNPRSTVGTITEIYDYLRLLFARIGVPHCPECGDEVSRQTIDQIVDRVLELGQNSIAKVMLMAPMIVDKKGEHKNAMEEIKKAGYVRVKFDNNVYDIEEALELNIDKKKKHNLDVIVDRLEIKPKPTREERTRVSESLETALDLGNGLVKVFLVDGEITKKLETRNKKQGTTTTTTTPLASPLIRGETTDDDGGEGNEILFSQHFSCPRCGVDLAELEPRSFSFNSPYGACGECTGLGHKLEIDPELVIPNKNLSIPEGAIRPWSRIAVNQGWNFKILEGMAKANKIPIDKQVKNLKPEELKLILYGTGDRKYDVEYASESFEGELNTTYEGVIPNLERRYKETESDYIRREIEKYMRTKICPRCAGKRLKPEALAVTVAGKSIAEVTGMTVEECREFFEGLA